MRGGCCLWLPGSWGTSPMPDTVHALAAELVGQVRAFQSRTEPYGESSQRTIWNFRVERFDDDGNLVLRVPVEMRGLSFQGSIADGDTVRVAGRERHGTVRARRVENRTTGAVVTARDQPIAITALGVLIAIVALVGALLVLAMFVGLFD